MSLRHPLFYFTLMESIATQHFPVFIWEAGRKWLYNPVLKKRFANRPEERIRLQWLEYLLHETGIKKSRIGFETPVTLRQEKNTVRADIVIYSRELTPYILVECKSESVRITPKTAEQAARYNSRLQAPYLILTNGIHDFCYHRQASGIVAAGLPFGEPDSSRTFLEKAEYWQARGFYSPGSTRAIRDWCTAVLPLFWSTGPEDQKQYLSFRESPLPVPMDHYYKISSVRADRKLAVTFCSFPRAGTYLIAVLNRNGINTDILSVHLDKLHNNSPESIFKYSGIGIEDYSDAGRAPGLFGLEPDASFKNLTHFLLSFFD